MARRCGVGAALGRTAAGQVRGGWVLESVGRAHHQVEDVGDGAISGVTGGMKYFRRGMDAEQKEPGGGKDATPERRAEPGAQGPEDQPQRGPRASPDEGPTSGGLSPERQELRDAAPGPARMPAKTLARHDAEHRFSEGVAGQSRFRPLDGGVRKVDFRREVAESFCEARERAAGVGT